MASRIQYPPASSATEPLAPTSLPVKDISLLVKVKRVFSSLLPYLSSFYLCKRAYNIWIMRETLWIQERGFYFKNGREIHFDITHALKYTGFHACNTPEPEFLKIKRAANQEKTEISVVSEDCLDVAKANSLNDKTPFVLDCGNAEDPCGSYGSGALSAEERIARSSALSLILDKRLGKQTKQFYPINPKIPHSTNVKGDDAFRGIYVPRVPVFREGPSKNYELLDEPFYISVGVIAAWNKPPMDLTENRIAAHYRNITRWRIRSLLNMAYENGHDTLILGALGCGAFRNPPRDIVDLFLEVIEKEYPVCFKKIIFAITEDHKPKGNFAVFKERIEAYNQSRLTFRNPRSLENRREFREEVFYAIGRQRWEEQEMLMSIRPINPLNSIRPAKMVTKLSFSER
jgi:uncharacterized protein (TIGR02452 family)